MSHKRADDQYNEREARRRLEAALRGARLAGPQHIESVTQKRAKPQRKKHVKKGS
jgi:hypothetical protein